MILPHVAAERLRSDSGGGAHITTARTKMPVWTIPPADTHDRGGISDEQVCCPLAQEPVELPLP